jgi:DNA-binding response OmpR family regulator
VHPNLSPTDTVHTVEPNSRILIVEDDKRIGASLARALNGTGYDTVWTETGESAIESISASLQAGLPFNLVLLDLGLPDLDGLDVCRRIVIIDPSVPVIMLTARDEELDMVVGLDSGAVDYITKPFSLAPLLARIRAQLRRSDDASTTVQGQRPIVLGALTIDRRTRTVVLDGQEVTLRAKEFDLLLRLANDVGAVVTREQLMNDVWDEHWFGSTKTLDFHIGALRARLDGNSKGRASMITTVRGVGFKLEKAPGNDPIPGVV